jgi:hypothetical protein
VLASVLAEAQPNEELAEAFRERWIVPRRRGVIAILKKAISQGQLRPDIDFELTTDLLYEPLYLQTPYWRGHNHDRLRGRTVRTIYGWSSARGIESVSSTVSVRRFADFETQIRRRYLGGLPSMKMVGNPGKRKAATHAGLYVSA